MYLTDNIDDMICTVSECKDFSNVQIIKAFPYVYKPTMLNKAVIVVSPSGIESENIEIGGDFQYGKYSIDFDIYIPQSLGSPVISQVVESLLNTVKGYEPKAISVSAISVDSKVDCYTAKCKFTFNGEINFGG